MDELKISIAILAIMLIIIGIVVNWPTAWKVYTTLFFLGNLVAIPATLMMLGGHRDASTPLWKTIAVPVGVITLAAPSLPILIPVAIISVKYRAAEKEQAEAPPVNPPGD